MRQNIHPGTIRHALSLLLVLAALACEKNTEPGGTPANPVPPPAPLETPRTTIACATRDTIRARLVPVGRLSRPKGFMSSAHAGNKILFVSGFGPQYVGDIDIFDIPSGKTRQTDLFQDVQGRYGFGVAAAGNNVLIAGGGDVMGEFQTARVDIYDVMNDTWSVSWLSEPRQSMATASLDDNIYFIGGTSSLESNPSPIIEYYDTRYNNWAIHQFSRPRLNLIVTSTRENLYITGGNKESPYSSTIDILYTSAYTSTLLNLSQPRRYTQGIAAQDQILLKDRDIYRSSANGEDVQIVDIIDIPTRTTTQACIPARDFTGLAASAEKVVFFTGFFGLGKPDNGRRFDVYDLKTKSWQTALLDTPLLNASIIAVNQVFYVAGGIDANGSFQDGIWTLEFYK